MELLALSINSDGYTQPIVTMEHNNLYEVVDGFHRNKVGKENELVRKRILGYLPIVKIKSDRTDKTDRMAATVRHNRARGKHKVESMSDMVIYLKRKNWNDQKIAKELGMEADEVLRLAQITGLTDAFKDVDFSNAWEITGL
jgi:ParB-like chromosome segregation protein Spo0J